MLLLLRQLVPASTSRQEPRPWIWRVTHNYANRARDEVGHAGVRRVGGDETSLRKGPEYPTLFVDLEEARVLFGTDGRESDTFRTFLEDHGGRSGWIREFCMDMSPAYRKGHRDHFP